MPGKEANGGGSGKEKSSAFAERSLAMHGSTDTQLVRSLQEHLRYFLLSTADSSGAAGLASF